MAKIKISGTIVSADYDDEFFAPWIDKGIITPSSRVVAALEAATEPVDLVINSYGGDVFAGGEMYVAIMKALASEKIASVEVQSYACSMAANIVAALAARGIAVTGYTQTQIMFHGCYTVVEGGAQHLEDTADSLRSVNETVIANLEKLGIEGCSTWFAEGREKWFNGQEALEAKLLTSLADGIVEEAPEMKATASRFAALARPGVGDYRGACAALVAENDLAELRETSAPAPSSSTRSSRTPRRRRPRRRPRRQPSRPSSTSSRPTSTARRTNASPRFSRSMTKNLPHSVRSATPPSMTSKPPARSRPV